MIFAIGGPGQRPRILLTAIDQDTAALSAAEGEVAVPVSGVGDYVIAPGGDQASFRVPALDEMQAALWDAVKVLRRRAEQAGCMSPFGPVQTDADSRAIIASYAASAADQGDPVDFTFADNTLVALDGAELRSLNLAVTSHLAAAHANAQRLRVLIDAAASPQALALIDIAAGWPGGAA
ncbi:MAG TPA: DUF4376 domain-containing protein [Novosphingobium sp.]|nr:DUF4376 domain-containing protein [Novosphingobium sp.]